MIQSYISFTETYEINRTDTASLNSSYLAMKTDVMDKVKESISNISGFEFVFSSETTPTASGTQTVYIYWDTPFGWQLRNTLVFTILTSGNLNITITISSDWYKNSLANSIHSAQTVAISAGNPVSVLVDIESILVSAPNFVYAGITRANQSMIAPNSIFQAAGYSMMRFRRLADNVQEWGLLRGNVTNVPIYTQPSTTLSAYGYSMQMIYGFTRTSGNTYSLLSMNEIYFNETASTTAAFSCKVEAVPDMLIVTMPSPVLEIGTKVKISESIYYVTVQVNGKAVLISI